MIIYGCEKNIFDYRTKYLGDYTLEINYSSWDVLNGPFDTTYSAEGNVDFGSDKNTIEILISGNAKAMTLDIFEDGTLQGKYDGEFESTNTFKMSIRQSSPGSVIYESIIGKKK